MPQTEEEICEEIENRPERIHFMMRNRYDLILLNPFRFLCLYPQKTAFSEIFSKNY